VLLLIKILAWYKPLPVSKSMTKPEILLLSCIAKRNENEIRIIYKILLKISFPARNYKLFSTVVSNKGCNKIFHRFSRHRLFFVP